MQNEVVLSNTQNKPRNCGGGNQKRSLLEVRGLGSGYLADQLTSLLGLFQIETALRQPPHAFHPRQVGLVLQLQEKNPALVRHMDADWASKCLIRERGRSLLLHLSSREKCFRLFHSQAELYLGAAGSHSVTRREGSTSGLKHHKLNKTRASQTF